MEKWADSIQAVATHFWGSPSVVKEEELRWGNQGSKVINLEKGTYYDFELEQGGGCTDLIKQYGPSNISVQEFLTDVIGMQNDDEQPQLKDVDDIKLPTKQTVYDYQDSQGKIIYQVIRYEPKTFRQRQVINGKAVWNLQGVSLLPFRLPNILKNQTKPVYIVEGEKDVLKLENLGLVASCNSGGSGKWTKEHSEYLKNRDVIVIPDNDEPGEKHSRQVIKSLQGVAKSIKLLQLPNLKPKGDVFDWLEDKSIKDLETLVEKTEFVSDKPMTPIKVMSITDVMNMPPVKWLIKNFIPENSMSMIYGSPGSGKTFVALDMSLHIAHNISWHDNDVIPGAVFYIAGEGVGGLRKRLQAWHNKKNIKPIAPVHIIPQAVGLLDEQAINDLIETIQAFKQDNIQLIVFDTVARCMAGDENSAQDMGLAIQAMDKIRNTFNCTVMPIHHSGKDSVKGARGSTAMIGAVDVSLKVQRQDKLVGLITEKQKDAEASDVVWFESEQVSLNDDELDLSSETSLVLKLSNEKAEKIKRLTPNQKELLNTLELALEEYGTEPGGKIPHKAVLYDKFKELAYEKIITTGNTQDAKRKAFVRTAKSLMQAGQIDKLGDWVWVVSGQVQADNVSGGKSTGNQGFNHYADN